MNDIIVNESASFGMPLSPSKSDGTDFSALIDDELIQRLLALARNRLGMELAWISHFTGDEQVIEAVNGALPGADVAVGFASPIEASYCIRVVSGELPSLIADAANNPVTAALDITAELGIGAYVAVPLRTEGDDVYGTLCCFSSQAEPSLQQRDSEILSMIADLISDHIDAKERVHQEHRNIRRRVSAVIDGGGPQMVFQPLFHLPDITLMGVEALSRFPAGFGGPDRWFHQAKQVGLGVELELSALDQALQILPLLAPDLLLTVNLSAESLCSDLLRQRLSDIQAERLIIELTEHAEISDFAAFRKQVAAIRDSGVRIAVDDAGSGYSGMRQLIEIKPDIIKMDYQITHGMDQDPARLAMATALLAFSNDTKSILLAEGVETAGELQSAVNLGITLAQGFYLGRPIGSEAIGSEQLGGSSARQHVIRQLVVPHPVM